MSQEPVNYKNAIIESDKDSKKTVGIIFLLAVISYVGLFSYLNEDQRNSVLIHIGIFISVIIVTFLSYTFLQKMKDGGNYIINIDDTETQEITLQTFKKDGMYTLYILNPALITQNHEFTSVQTYNKFIEPKSGDEMDFSSKGKVFNIKFVRKV